MYHITKTWSGIYPFYSWLGGPLGQLPHLIATSFCVYLNIVPRYKRSVDTHSSPDSHRVTRFLAAMGRWLLCRDMRNYVTWITPHRVGHTVQRFTANTLSYKNCSGKFTSIVKISFYIMTCCPSPSNRLYCDYLYTLATSLCWPLTTAVQYSTSLLLSYSYAWQL